MNLFYHRKKIERKSTLKRKFIKLLNSLIVLSAIFGFIGIIYYFFNVSDLLRISDIEIIGTKNFVNYRDLKEVLQTKMYGKNILTVNVEDSQKALLDTFQGARKIKIEKKFPKKIKVLVVERVPLALIYNGQSQNFFMIDEDGYVLGIVDENSTNLARIRYEGDIRVGMFINKTLVPFYLELTKVLLNEEVKVSSMSFYSNYVELYLDTEIRTLISSEKNISNSIKVLLVILKQIALEGRRPNVVDLRYAKVIVSYD